MIGMPRRLWVPDLPDIQFTGGNSATLAMQLFLDTSVTGGDVRDTVNKIHNLMKINPNATDMAPLHREGLHLLNSSGVKPGRLKPLLPVSQKDILFFVKTACPYGLLLISLSCRASER